MKNKRKMPLAVLALILCGCALFAMTGCSSAAAEGADSGVFSSSAQTGQTSLSAGSAILNGEELFTSRDLEQTPDLSEAAVITLSDGQEVDISEEGVYLLQGTAKNTVVIVEADENAKVQLVLDGVSMENENFPCIYVRSADKVFVTTVSDSSLSVTASFVSDGTTGTDGVIFSKDDLVLSGSGRLTIHSSHNGVVCKDDLKITGGSYDITASAKCLEAKDSVRIADGSFTLNAGSDGIHAENDEDDSLGYVYIGGGSFTIDAGDDGIHANAFVQIDGGSFQISAAEGIEGTTIQINDGTISIQSWDDGINAAHKSSSYGVMVEINGGEISISMGAGDTDGIDSNGSIVINGGTVSITGNSSFDYDGNAQLNGGTVIVNGQELDYIPNQMMGGFGGMGGGPGGFGGMGGGPGGNPGGGFGGGPGGRH